MTEMEMFRIEKIEREREMESTMRDVNREK